ncbi:ATP-binding protein [Catellatospora coxensis]
MQEAVTNVVRHAAAPRCAVTVDYRDTELRLTIADEGRGCPQPGSGYGITGMRERVALLGGEFTAGPQARGGFLVTARFPLPEPAALAPEPREPSAAAGPVPALSEHAPADPPGVGAVAR